MKRVKLIFNRNQNEDTKSYRIYRNSSGNVGRKDKFIMEIEHPDEENQIYIKEETLKRISVNEYHTNYQKIIADNINYPLEIFVNNQIYNQSTNSIMIDYVNGIIQFPQSFSVTDVITANYYIDGISVFDTDEITQEKVKYYGPTAKDNSRVKTPENPYLVPENTEARIKLTWDDANLYGQPFYYRIESVDKYGNFSNLSEERKAILKNSDNVTLYIIEKTFDNPDLESAVWRVIAKQESSTYYEYGVDKEPPGPVTNLVGDCILHHGDSIATVPLNWSEALPGAFSQSGIYRIRSVSNNGSISQPSDYVGPVALRSIVHKYIIRRKINDGSLPTYKGNDALTVGTVYNPIISFSDTEVPDNKEYIYGIYSVDKAGNYSIVTTTIVEVGDATPPDPVRGLTAAQYSYIY